MLGPPRVRSGRLAPRSRVILPQMWPLWDAAVRRPPRPASRHREPLQPRSAEQERSGIRVSRAPRPMLPPRPMGRPRPARQRGYRDAGRPDPAGQADARLCPRIRRPAGQEDFSAASPANACRGAGPSQPVARRWPLRPGMPQRGRWRQHRRRRWRRRGHPMPRVEQLDLHRLHVPGALGALGAFGAPACPQLQLLVNLAPIWHREARAPVGAGSRFSSESSSLIIN